MELAFKIAGILAVALGLATIVCLIGHELYKHSDKNNPFTKLLLVFLSVFIIAVITTEILSGTADPLCPNCNQPVTADYCPECNRNAKEME